MEDEGYNPETSRKDFAKWQAAVSSDVVSPTGETLVSSSFVDGEQQMLELLESSKKKKQYWWSDIYSKIETWLTNWVGKNNYELELRFGRFGKNHEFLANIEKKTFFDILKLISTDPTWRPVENEWRGIQDLCFRHGFRLSQLQGESHYTPQCKLNVFTHEVDLRNSNYDLRFSLNAELPADEIYSDVPTHYRLKNRKSFYRYPFVIDFTIVKEGKENNCLSSDPVYELEIEWIRGSPDVTKDYRNLVMTKVEIEDFLANKTQYLDRFFHIVNRIVNVLYSKEAPISAIEKIEKANDAKEKKRPPKAPRNSQFTPVPKKEPETPEVKASNFLDSFPEIKKELQELVPVKNTVTSDQKPEIASSPPGKKKSTKRTQKKNVTESIFDRPLITKSNSAPVVASPTSEPSKPSIFSPLEVDESLNPF